MLKNLYDPSRNHSTAMVPMQFIIRTVAWMTLVVLLSNCSDKQNTPPSTATSNSASAPTSQSLQLERLKVSANAGEPNAMFELSQMYSEGKEVEINRDLAEHYLRRAVDANHPEAVYEWAQELRKKTAIVWILSGDSNEEKFADAQVSFKDAERFYLKALDLGISKAAQDLGNLYDDGLRNIAATLEIPTSRISKEYLGDTDKAIFFYEKAANLSMPRSMVAMYRLHSVPRFGKVNREVAASWFKKIESLSNARDLGEAADALYYGAYVDDSQLIVVEEFQPKSEWVKEAQPLLERAANGGDVASQVLLARIYLNGFNGHKSASLAADYLKQAASGNDVWARVMLGRLHMSGSGVYQDYSTAWKLFSEAAGIAEYDPDAWEARYLLGVLLEKGLGVQKDLVLAHAWYNIAATNGHEKAAARRAAVTSQLTAEELSEAQALAKDWTAGAALVRDGVGRSPISGSTQGVATRKVGAGTMFYVTPDGMAVTNSHVVAGCKEVRVSGNSESARVVTQDVVNDLALVKVDGLPKKYGRVASDPGRIRQGDEILVFGYPLNSLLSSSGNLTPGIVSALTGLGNNTNQIQITAPIQPGSSGSPVLDAKGSVIGVVSMKLSDSKLASATGQVGQTVNFAVNGQTLRSFLDAHQVPYSTGGWLLRWGKSKADLADNAKEWTTVVECWQ